MVGSMPLNSSCISMFSEALLHHRPKSYKDMDIQNLKLSLSNNKGPAAVLKEEVG